MAEDLRVSRFNDGTPVTQVTQWITSFQYEIPRYYFVENSYFYNQLVTTNAKQICPLDIDYQLTKTYTHKRFHGTVLMMMLTI